jgi:hypothetical protein
LHIQDRRHLHREVVVLDGSGLGTPNPLTVHDDETERSREPPAVSSRA